MAGQDGPHLIQRPPPGLGPPPSHPRAQTRGVRGGDFMFYFSPLSVEFATRMRDG